VCIPRDICIKEAKIFGDNEKEASLFPFMSVYLRDLGFLTARIECTKSEEGTREECEVTRKEGGHQESVRSQTRKE
jgi:hypothetical protein